MFQTVILMTAQFLAFINKIKFKRGHYMSLIQAIRYNEINTRVDS